MADHTYTVHEVADLASHREGTEIKVRDLTSAKRTARVRPRSTSPPT